MLTSHGRNADQQPPGIGIVFNGIERRWSVVVLTASSIVRSLTQIPTFDPVNLRGATATSGPGNLRPPPVPVRVRREPYALRADALSSFPAA